MMNTPNTNEKKNPKNKTPSTRGFVQQTLLSERVLGRKPHDITAILATPSPTTAKDSSFDTKTVTATPMSMVDNQKTTTSENEPTLPATQPAQEDEEPLDVDKGSVSASQYDLSFFIDHLPRELLQPYESSKFTKKDITFALAQAREHLGNDDFNEFNAANTFNSYLHDIIAYDHALSNSVNNFSPPEPPSRIATASKSPHRPDGNRRTSSPTPSNTSRSRSSNLGSVDSVDTWRDDDKSSSDMTGPEKETRTVRNRERQKRKRRRKAAAVKQKAQERLHNQQHDMTLKKDSTQPNDNSNMEMVASLQSTPRRLATGRGNTTPNPQMKECNHTDNDAGEKTIVPTMISTEQTTTRNTTYDNKKTTQNQKTNNDNTDLISPPTSPIKLSGNSNSSASNIGDDTEMMEDLTRKDTDYESSNDSNSPPSSTIKTPDIANNSASNTHHDTAMADSSSREEADDATAGVGNTSRQTHQYRPPSTINTFRRRNETNNAVALPKGRRTGEQASNPYSAREKNVSYFPASPIMCRYETRISLDESEKPNDECWTKIYNFFKTILDANRTAVLYPWNDEDNRGPPEKRKHKAISDAKKIPTDPRGWKTYFDRANPIKAGGSMYPSIFLGHTIPYDQLVDTIQWFLRAEGHGWYERKLQVAKTRLMGWLMYSLRTINIEHLEEMILTITGITFAMRWRTIAVVSTTRQGKGQIPADQLIKAIHVECASKDYHKGKEGLRKLYSSTSIWFPLGIKM